MLIHRRKTENEEQAQIAMLDGGVRLWRVTYDPSNMFLHRSFRVSDLSAGGFDQGTTFIHIHTGEKRMVGADGIPRKMNNEKDRRGRKKLEYEKTAQRGGTHAVL